MRSSWLNNRIVFLIVNSFLFAVAMGWLEGVVVVYLRTILERRPDWKTIEISREAATLVMLITFSLLAGRDRKERWGLFMWLFGIWDIIYYVCLWVWLKWPDSLMTVDTLFYIPCVWEAPVYVPVLFSLLMMLIGFFLVLNRGLDFISNGAWWGLGGWLAGLLIGLANAWIKELPLWVSAMGISVYLGVMLFGAGVANTVSAKSAGRLSLFSLGVIAASGIAGGILGHLARSMFYTSPYSFWWSIGLGLMLTATIGMLVKVRHENRRY